MTEVRQRLLAMRDEDYTGFIRRVVPVGDGSSVIGVRMPQVRRLALEVEPRSAPFLASLPHLYFEENQIHAVLVSREKDYDRCIEMVDSLLPHINNWATCDCLRPRVLASRPETTLAHVRRWMQSQWPYSVRFGIGVLEAYFLDDLFSPEQLQWVAGLDREEYYVRMMQAWYFATALAKQWDAARPVVDSLQPWVRRRAVVKARESFRVSKEHKDDLLRALPQ